MDKILLPNTSFNPADFVQKNKSYTLDDLEKDDRFQETSERFLNSIGENSSDVFEYLRDSDFNLFSGMNRAMQSGKFTEQQKKDYAYLRSKFTGADMGSLKQYFELIKDSTIDMVTDPTLIVAALATPITSGTSLAARAGVTSASKALTDQVVKANLKTAAKKQIRKVTGISAAEVGAWTGLDNHFRQNTELNVGLRKMYSAPELVGSTALGALTGGLFGNLAQRSAIYQDKSSRLFSNDEYRKEAGSELLYKLSIAKDKVLAKSFGNANSILKTVAKYSPTAKELGQKFTDDFQKKFTTLSTKRLGFSYGEDLDFLRSTYIANRDLALAPIYKAGKILPEDEIDVIRILRGDSPAKYSKAVQESAVEFRKFFDTIVTDATAAGLKPHPIPNYFTRSWNRKAIEDNRQNFERKLLDEKVDGVTPDNVGDIVDAMLNKNDELYSAHAHLLTQSRAFKNLDDNAFEEFLNNDLTEVVTNYAFNSAKIIEEQRTFLLPNPVKITGKTEDGLLMGFRESSESQFTKRYVNVIDKELRDVRGKGLTKKQKTDLVNLYRSVTGKDKSYNSDIVQGLYDATKLANAVAYLPLATIGSLTEAFIPLTKAKPSSAVKGALDAIKNGHKILVDETGELIGKKYNLSDTQIRKEMRSVMIAVDESMSDMTNRLAGEGMQNNITKSIARAFYRLNLLTPWTKTIQLSAFSTGKDLIRGNLEKLNVLTKQGIDVLDETKLAQKALDDVKDKSRLAELFSGSKENPLLQIQRLKSELFDLNIDIADGLKWLDAGAKQTDTFYNNQLVRGAGRFTNSVILPTTRERARIPTYMTNPRFDILTQFLRYPFAFSNTVLKNFARDTITNPLTNAPKVAAFTMMATNVALATNYYRSSEEKQAEMFDDDNFNLTIAEAFQRVGLMGPFETGFRYTEAVADGNKNPIAALSNLAGPTASDAVNLLMYGKLTETFARKAPLIGTQNIIKNITGLDPYTPILEGARKIDKSINEVIIKGAETVQGEENLKNRGSINTGIRTGLFLGGKVEGVSDVKSEPENRVDPFTGEPYASVSPVIADSIIREYEEEKMFKEKSILESLEARRLARKTANKGGLINRLKYREAFLIGGLAAKGVANIIKRLPNKVYHGGTDLASAKGGVEKVKGIFTAGDKIYADSFADPNSLGRKFLTGEKLQDVPASKFGLFEYDISKVSKPYLLDDPSEDMLKIIDNDLIKVMDDNSLEGIQKYNLLSQLRDYQNKSIGTGDFYLIKDEAFDYLKSKGVDLVTTSKFLRGGPDSEFLLLKSFPAKKVTKVEVKSDTIKTPTWFKETKVKTDVDPADAQKTQVAITSGTYKKVVPLLKEGDTLDFGAGLGKGAKILKADSYEPFPKKGFKPTFTETSAIPNSSYDNVVSLNVLNVVKPDVRNDIVLDIGRILKPEGTAIITTRGSDIFGNKNNITKGVLSNLEDGAIITSSGTYQKGFTNTELKNYVSELLGKDFKVENITGLGKAGIKVTKL